MTSTQERRMRAERRERDIGPPRGCFDRRRRAERRLPSAEESVISDDEWALYFGSSTGVTTSANAMLEHAAAVLDKVHTRN